MPDPEPDEDCVWLSVGADSLPLPLPLPEPMLYPVSRVLSNPVVEVGVYVVYEESVKRVVVLEELEDE